MHKDNMLDENAAMMLEYGLQTHPSIETELEQAGTSAIPSQDSGTPD